MCKTLIGENTAKNKVKKAEKSGRTVRSQHRSSTWAKRALGRKKIRRQHRSKNISTRPMGSSQARVVRQRNPALGRNGLTF